MGFIASDNGIANKRHVVALFQPGEPIPDGEGGFVEPLVPLDPPLWSVSIDTDVPGREALIGSAVHASVTHIIRGDWRPDVNTQTQMTFQQRRFWVRSVDDVQEARRELRVLVEEDASTKDPAAHRMPIGVHDGVRQPTRTPGVERTPSGAQSVAAGLND